MGAVYRPLEDMVPPVADQVTLVLVEPVTVAVNCCVPPVGRLTDVGVIVTLTVVVLLDLVLTM